MFGARSHTDIATADECFSSFISIMLANASSCRGLAHAAVATGLRTTSGAASEYDHVRMVLFTFGEAFGLERPRRTGHSHVIFTAHYGITIYRTHP